MILLDSSREATSSRSDSLIGEELAALAVAVVVDDGRVGAVQLPEEAEAEDAGGRPVGGAVGDDDWTARVGVPDGGHTGWST